MYKDYNELMKKVDDLYNLKDYEQAMDILDSAAEKLPDGEYTKNYFILMYVKEIIANRMGQDEKHFLILEELIDKGYACSKFMLNRQKNRENFDFETLEKKNNLLLKKLQDEAEFKYEVYLPEDYSVDNKYPLLIALHGDGGDGNIEDLKSGWKPEPFLSRGFIVIYAQSSQVWCHNGYAWLPDLNITRNELKKGYTEILQKYSINETKVFVGGYSGGAIASLDITMTNTIPVTGFIALCPEIMKESFTLENVIKAKDRGVRGIILEGEIMMPVADEEEMMKILDEVNFPYEFYKNKGIGHEIPKDFSAKMENALDFLLAY